LTTSQL